MNNSDFKQKYSRLNKDARIKECFHSDSECSDSIVQAHSIQNNTILKHISTGGYVMSFDFEIDEVTKDLNLNFAEKGRKIASTFTGFCNEHDQMIFRPIEYSKYSLGNKEQEFLFSYRALAREYYAKKVSSNFSNILCELILKKDFEGLKKYFSDDSSIINTKNITDEIYQQLFLPFAIGTRRTLNQLEEERISFNMNLKNKKYYKIYSFIIELSEEYLLAASSVFFLEEDFEGNVINNLGDLKNRLKPIFLTIFPQDGKTYIILSCYNIEKNYYNKFFNQLSILSNNDKMISITNILAMHVENLFFSPEKWTALPDKTKKWFLMKSRNTTLATKVSIKAAESYNIFV